MLVYNQPFKKLGKALNPHAMCMSRRARGEKRGHRGQAASIYNPISSMSMPLAPPLVGHKNQYI